MAQFDIKLLSAPKRVCFRLKEMRESKQTSLAEISARTRISQKYLESIEACDFSSIPFAVVYKKNILKRYAEAIGADACEMVRQFEEEEIVIDPIAVIPPSGGARVRMQNFPMLIRGLFLGAILFAMSGYLGLQVKRIIDPPRLRVFSPQDGFVTAEQTVVVQGQSEREVRISINGRQIGAGDDGQFKEVLDLSPGMNAIAIAAEKKHGKTTTDTRYVIHKMNPSVTLNKKGLTLQ